MGKSAKAPDPYATAAAQGAANDDTARLNASLNRGDTIAPWGTVTNRDLGAEWAAAEKGRERERFAAGQSPLATWNDSVIDNAIAARNPLKDKWQTTTTLSPEQQAIYDAQTQTTLTSSQAAEDASGRLRTMLETPLDTSRLNPLTTSVAPGALQTSIADAGAVRSDFSTGSPLARMGNEDYEQSRQRVEQALLDRQAPQQRRDQEAQDARLAAQGISVGSEAYDATERNRQMGVNDARLAAVLAGGQEQSRLFGMDLSRMQANNGASQAETQAWNTGLAAMNGAQGQRFAQNQTQAQFGNDAAQQLFGMNLQAANFGNGVRGQQLAEALQMRAQPINEVAALFGLGNGITVPTASSLTPTASQSGDIAGALNSNYQAKAQQAASGNQAAAGLAATAATAAIAI